MMRERRSICRAENMRGDLARKGDHGALVVQGILALGVVGVGAGMVKGAGPATGPATAAVAEEENPFLTADIPASGIGEMSISDVVRFSITGDFLGAQTTLTPRPMQMQRVKGYPRPVQIQIQHRGQTSPLYTPDSLQLMYVNSPGNPAVRTNLFTAINYLSLSRDIVLPGGVEKMVQFNQSQMGAALDTAVSLHVQVLTGAEGDDKMMLSAESFAAFIRRYPKETAQYIRPMIETFGRQARLFAVEDSLAFGVFPEAFGSDVGKRKEVQALVGQLGADDYQQRQAAQQKLEKMGVGGAAMLETMDRSKLSAEQATRVDGIIARVKPRFETSPARLREDVGFLLDCLLSENALLRKAALAQLKSVTRTRVNFTEAADRATREDQVYALRDELLGDATTRPSVK